ncbi:MAG TPA: LytTR family DNA-binding domain-containing protein [Phenylobacterium sp.]|nr:LytTR family DNA-binding domain-containing protein [Phenylobacterium sp.]
MPHLTVPPWLRRSLADLALFAGVGLVTAFLGPFGSISLTLPERLGYWIACLVGGGVAGVLVDEGVRRLTERFWPRLLAVSLGMTPPVTLIVTVINLGFYQQRLPLSRTPQFMFQVWVISFAVMALRQLVWAQSAPAPPPATEAAPADPLEAFRQRLSAKRRAAVLFAIEAEDHYLRVHTEAGDELITARFGDALKELAAAPGFQTHRSWWVAADAIDDVRWKKGRGEAHLKCGLVVPISRANAPPLKAAGWF